MPVTAKFQADFSSFQDACEKAQVELKAIETDANKVEKSLTRMGNSLSGTKLIQDATLMAAAVDKVGGVSALTEKEVERLSAQAQEAAAKMQKLGIGVPENIQKIADAAKPADSGILGMASSVTKLASAVGIGFSVSAVVGFGKSLLDDA